MFKITYNIFKDEDELVEFHIKFESKSAFDLSDTMIPRKDEFVILKEEPDRLLWVEKVVYMLNYSHMVEEVVIYLRG